MKAVIYHSHTDIRIECLPIPTIKQDEVLVRVHGCGLCGSDIGKIAQQAPAPVSLGHELTGTIVECGSDIVALKEGQEVIVAHHVPCGTCYYCQHHNYSMCLAFKASNIDPCGLAEYIRVPAAHVQHTTLPRPSSLSPEEASFTEPLACCVRAVRRTPLCDGDTVIVMGLGSIGLLMLQALKALALLDGHALHVVVLDLLPARLELACALGADAAFLAPQDTKEVFAMLAPHTEGRGADCAMLTVAGARPFLQAFNSVRKGGSIHIFAAHSAMTPIDLQAIYQQELSILSTYSSSPEELRIALDLLTRRLVRVDQLISHRLPLDRFHEGVTLMRDHAALKVYFQIAGESYGK